MFNLPFSKRNNHEAMNTMNEWNVNGVVTYTRYTEKGMWLTIKGKASRPNLFTSDKMSFDCFVPQRLINRKSFRTICAKGKFEFNNNESYFVVSEFLKEA